MGKAPAENVRQPVSRAENFVQRYWYVCPIEDIAADLGISKSKVSVTLMRTRQKLRKHLEQEGFL